MSAATAAKWLSPTMVRETLAVPSSVTEPVKSYSLTGLAPKHFDAMHDSRCPVLVFVTTAEDGELAPPVAAPVTIASSFLNRRATECLYNYVPAKHFVQLVEPDNYAGTLVYPSALSYGAPRYQIAARSNLPPLPAAEPDWLVGSYEVPETSRCWQPLSNSSSGWRMGEIKALIADRMQEWDTEPLSHLMEVGTKHSTERTLEAWQGIEFSTWNAAAGEALRFLRRLPGGLEMPSYSRSRSGLVSLVWSRTEHYCEVEFSGEGQFNIYLRYPDKHSEFFAELDSATPMVPVVSGLLKKLSDALREKAVTASIAV